MRRLPSLDRLNGASPSEFADALAPPFEGAPRFLARLAAARPFETLDRMLDAARRVAHDMPEAEQIELLDAHPPIGAAPGAMSELSRREQGDGSGADAGLADRLADLNRRYEGRFGFRYVVFVAGRTRAEIVPLLEAALWSDREAELHRGLDEVVTIAGDRLGKLDVGATPGPTIGS